jgi:2-polyprenyl-3-methyl-5-hydroxy-6-metoxy-1,4-benzoquinol methylase
MSGAAFWSERVSSYGHTGWSDAAVYAYDQRLRLAALRQWLDTQVFPRDASALDFGCGTGDFCALLAERFGTVVGCDLSPAVLAVAAQRHASPRIRYTADVDAALAQRHALILCVTVLQHVVDDAELLALLQRFAAALEPGGQVVVLETFAAGAPATNDYLKRRTLDSLVAAFAAAGLTLRSQRGFYHPSESPTPAFLAYRQRPTVRLLARLAPWRLPGVRGWLNLLGARAARADGDAMDCANSPTQWLVFARSAA